MSKEYVLKNKLCMSRTRGVIYMSCDLVFHPIRAGIRVFTPRDRVPEEKPKLQTKVSLILENFFCFLHAITHSHLYSYSNSIISMEIKMLSNLWCIM